MTVDELLRLLASYSPDLRVVVNGYEDGYDDLSPPQISVIKIALNTGERRWEGQHGDPNGLTRSASGNADVVEALVLRRVSN